MVGPCGCRLLWVVTKELPLHRHYCVDCLFSKCCVSARSLKDFFKFNFFINILFLALTHEYWNVSFHCLVQLTGCCGTSGNPEKSTKIVRICCYLLLSFRRIAEALNQIAKLGYCSSAVLPGCFQHSLSSWLFQTPPKHFINYSFQVWISLLASLFKLLGCFPLHTSDKKIVTKTISLGWTRFSVF